MHSNRFYWKQTMDIYCPKCMSFDVERLPKRFHERILNDLTFKLLDLKHYKCYACLHKGTLSARVHVRTRAKSNQSKISVK